MLGGPKPHDPKKSEGYVVRDRRASGDADAPVQPPKDAESVEQLRQEVQQLKDQYLRTLADVDNIKKRIQREKEEFLQFAAEGFVRELLPIIDGLDQAVAAVDKQADAKAIIKGVHMIYRQLLGMLEKEGVTRIPTVGHVFDPHLHEAVGHVEPHNGEADGMIVEEIHVGYTMHGKVVRPSLVKIAKQKKPESELKEESHNG